MPDFPDYYEILGVSNTASQEEIKVHYLRLVKELHPDRNNGDLGLEDQLKQVNAANQVLSDPRKRIEYDRMWNNILGHAKLNPLSLIRQRKARVRETATSRTQVTSTIFKSIGYDRSTQVLEVEFRSGAIFQYMDVPDFLHAEFMSTDKKGTFYRERIISNYRERCVR